MLEMELVTVLRIRLMMILYKSVSRMREFESITDLVIVVGLRKDMFACPRN